jgi:mono/diheme cytochrome c family protein
VFWRSGEKEAGMTRKPEGSPQAVRWLLAALIIAASVGLAAWALGNGDRSARVALSDELQQQVLRGRVLTLSHGCGDCHGGMPNPAAEGYLAGNEEPEVLGPFRVWPSNLTPDEETGLGRYTDRQIFNALRYGLRPSASPDAEITSHVPGEGSHPANPNYLAPAMPWVHWRYLSDDELWDIVAYLRHGLLPVRHAVPASEGPPDHWAGEFAPEKIGSHVLPPFPTEHEELRDATRRDEVLRGRNLVAHLACTACHGGGVHPGHYGWLIGAHPESPLPVFEIGPFKTYARNLTPDNATGMGRFTERQIFNSIRYGLRPGETPDVEITSTVAGQGNHPARPKYLAPPMPWPAWRHLSDREIRDIAAYLKLGVRPVSNRVPDSEGPPDFWASEYTEAKYGTWPPPPFPTARERGFVR